MLVLPLIFFLTFSLYYNIKKRTGSERWIAKLLLNCLYGTFGRSVNTTSCLVIHASELAYYVSKYVVLSFLEINKDTFTIIVKNNINPHLLSNLNSYFEHSFELNSKQTVINNNVIKVPRGIEPLKKVLTVLHINHSDMAPPLLINYRNYIFPFKVIE